MEEFKIIKKIIAISFKFIVCFIGFLISVPFTMFMNMDQKSYFSLQSIRLFEDLYKEIARLQDQLKEKIKKED